MDMSNSQIVFAVTASFAYLGLYGYRKWRTVQKDRCENGLQCRAVRYSVFDSHSAWKRSKSAFLNSVNASKVIAVDFQWEVSPIDPPKIVSLSLVASKQEVTLFKLSEFTQIPEELEHVLDDPSIIKVGVDIVDSAASLKKDCGIELQGCIDLRYIAMKSPALRHELLLARADLSLSTLSKTVLGVHVASDRQMHARDWIGREPSTEQNHDLAERAVSIFEVTREICCRSGAIPYVLGALRPEYWLEHFISHEFAMYADVPFRVERLTRVQLPLESSAPSEPLNICFFCGITADLTYAYIVPEEYHHAFDQRPNCTLILCGGCEDEFRCSQDILKQQLEKFFDAPIIDPDRPYHEDDDLKELREAGNMLLQHRDTLSEERRWRLENCLMQAFEVEELNEEIIRAAASVDYRIPIVSFEYHGKLVSERWPDHKLLLLQEIWREHFILQMIPALMPQSAASEE